MNTFDFDFWNLLDELAAVRSDAVRQKVPHLYNFYYEDRIRPVNGGQIIGSKSV